jgi:hypothetical protein
MKIAVFWDMTPCNLWIDTNIAGESSASIITSTLKKETPTFSETSVLSTKLQIVEVQKCEPR